MPPIRHLIHRRLRRTAVHRCVRDEPSPLTGSIGRRLPCRSASALWPPSPDDLLGAHPLYLAVLATSVPAALLAVAATGPLGRRLALWPAQIARLTAVAVITCAAGDGLLLATLVRIAVSTPHVLAWPTAVFAAAASIVRLSLAARAAHHCLTMSSIRVAARR